MRTARSISGGDAGRVRAHRVRQSYSKVMLEEFQVLRGLRNKLPSELRATTSLLDEQRLREKLDALFVKECLALLGLPSTPALATCIEAGSLALPRLAKLAVRCPPYTRTARAQSSPSTHFARMIHSGREHVVAVRPHACAQSVLKTKYAELCKSGATLPIDLDLGPNFTFHSTFTCPISKELATPDNPPMMLPCGHVLALGSVTKLARGSRSARFKCPYCPAQSKIAAAQSLSI